MNQIQQVTISTEMRK